MINKVVLLDCPIGRFESSKYKGRVGGYLPFFDQSLQYQFSLFFDDQVKASDAIGFVRGSLATIVGTSLIGPTLGLRFSPEERDEGFLGPAPLVNWRASSGIWRLTWTPGRVDLVFDAAGYFTVGDKEISLGEAKNRVSANLGALADSTPQHVNRIALIFNGQSSCNDLLRPNVIVARRFFKQEIQASVDQNQILDISAQTNSIGSWNINGVEGVQGRPLVVNRLEQGTAIWRFLKPDESRPYLQWALDVNTAPLPGPNIRFHAQAITDFLNQAEQWISQQVGQLEHSSRA